MKHFYGVHAELESRSNGAGDGPLALSKPVPAPVSVG